MYDSRRQALEAFAGRHTSISSPAPWIRAANRVSTRRQRTQAAAIEQGRITILVLLLLSVAAVSIAAGWGRQRRWRRFPAALRWTAKPLAGAAVTFEPAGAAALFSGLHSTGSTDAS